MSLDLGRKLQIRAMIYVAGEPIPFFWPMRSFIHHNPLHGLEHLPFEEAVTKGERLFHAHGFLPRSEYQRYLSEGKVDRRALTHGVAEFTARTGGLPGIDLHKWLMAVLTSTAPQVVLPHTLADAQDIHDALTGTALRPDADPEPETLTQRLRDELLGPRPVYEAVDALYGTDMGPELDELVIKSCLDFFDEGQSVWRMPGREQGLFAAWREVARRNGRLFLRGLHLNEALAADDTPEGVIAYVMNALGIPEQHWAGYFSRELARLHGWTGFIRWRSSAKHYYWSQRYPADLVDFVALRLTLALALLGGRGRRQLPHTADAIAELIDARPKEAYLRHELHGRHVLPSMAQRVEAALLRGNAERIAAVFSDYAAQKRTHEAQSQAARLRELAAAAGETEALDQTSAETLDRLLAMLADFEKREGMIWLRAMEQNAMGRLLKGVSLEPPAPREKRPFAQALFCIDTRSERIRRHLEGVGDYQTFGIAGFFGVPISFVELGKGSENHLCPVLLTPKNLVLELTDAGSADQPAVTALEKAMHELKESVLTPFVTVEAIGLLFGFDMVGKTLFPKSYHRWRKHLHPEKPATRLLIDKLDREQADSVVRAVQRAVIVKAVEQELGLPPERITDDTIRALRESALDNEDRVDELTSALDLDDDGARKFLDRLRNAYRINRAFAQRQMEQLGRIGFSVDEQARFVAQALSSIGLTSGFSRFVLLVGHGSTSDNNPYESALDCGACGGNHGLTNARVLAQMANRPAVRRRLREHGIDIPDDAWFVPALHNTTTDEVSCCDVDMLPASHLVYVERLRKGLAGASRLCAQERIATLQLQTDPRDPTSAFRMAQRNAVDWSQVRPEWGLSGNAYFIIGRRDLTRQLALEGRAFLHSYDYRVDPKRRLLENILTGPLVVGQWINMEHYFSTVDNERFGSGSKVYHNVAGRFGVMTGNLSDLRTGLPAQTVLEQGRPYHDPIRLVTVIEAPFDHARRAVEGVIAVKRLVQNGWIRLVVIDPETATVSIYDEGEWRTQTHSAAQAQAILEEAETP